MAPPSVSPRDRLRCAQLVGDPELRAAALVLLVCLAGALGCSQQSLVPAGSTGPALPMAQALDRPVAFDQDVRPVLERRCAVCHGCYDAPCQLILTSAGRPVRGATQQPVYDS